MDKTIGRGALFCFPRPAAVTTPLPIKKVLLIRPGGIGDAVLLIPALHALRKFLPDCSIDILAERRNSASFALAPMVDSVFRYDVPRELLAALRNRYDAVIDTEQWHRLSALVARMSRARLLIGYATNHRGKMFTHQVGYSHEEHEIQSFLNLLVPVAGTVVWDRVIPFLKVPLSAVREARALLAPQSTGESVSIFPGSSIRERKWGTERFQKTADLLNRQGFNIVVIGGKNDRGGGEAITRAVAGSLNLCGVLTLPGTAAVLQKSSLLITGDSGLMHMAYGLGTRVIALFGPGREKKWAPHSSSCVVINKHLPCSPCTNFGYTPRCKQNAACMKGITVDEVFRESMRLLARKE